MIISTVQDVVRSENGWHYAEDIFEHIFYYHSLLALNNSALDQIMAWCWTGNKPSPEPITTKFTDSGTWVIIYINLWLSSIAVSQSDAGLFLLTNMDFNWECFGNPGPRPQWVKLSIHKRHPIPHHKEVYSEYLETKSDSEIWRVHIIRLLGS